MSEGLYGYRRPERGKGWRLFGSTVAVLGVVAGGAYAKHENDEMNKKVRNTSRAINVADLAVRMTCYRTTLPPLDLNPVQRIIAGVPNKLWYKLSIQRDPAHVDLSSATSFLFKDGWMYNTPFTGNERLYVGVVGTDRPVDAQVCGGRDGRQQLISVVDNGLESKAQVVLLTKK